MIKRILRNFSWLSVAVAAEIGLGMVVTALLARSLGPTDFGRYSLWLSFTALFTPLYDFGLVPLSLRVVAQNLDSSTYYMRTVWSVKIVLGGLGLLVLASVACLLGYFGDTILVVAFLLLAISQIVRTFSVLNRAILRAYEWMRLQAYVGAASSLGRLLAVVVIIILDLNLVWVCLVLAVVNFAEFLATSQIIRSRVLSIFSENQSDQRQSTRGILKASAPFALSDLFNVTYMRADSVLLGELAGVQAVSWYVAAYKIVTLIGLLPRTLMDGIYPILCKESKESASVLVRKLFIIFELAAFPICFTVMLFSPEIIDFIYGAEYQPASQALQMLIWASFFVFGGSLMLTTLNALKRERTVAKVSGIISITGVVAFFLCIPRWGYLGASVVSVGIEAVGFILMFIATSRELGRSLLSFGSVVRIAFACGAATATVWFLSEHISKIASLAIALVLYLVITLYEIQRSTGVLTSSRLATVESYLLSVLRVSR